MISLIKEFIVFHRGQNFKDLIEYFFVVRNSTENNQNEALQVMEHGIKPSVHQVVGRLSGFEMVSIVCLISRELFV